MAKQNVTFIERHLEKIVIGVAGTILLGTVAMFLISSPNQIEGPDGGGIGPTALYEDAKEKAEMLRNRIRQAEPKPPEDRPPVPKGNISPYGDLPLAWNDHIFAPLHPSVPDIGGIQSEAGKVELAEIIAPGRPVAVTGKAYAPLPDQVRVPAGATEIPEPLPPLSRDYRWVTVVAGFNRKEQRELFRKAGYGRERERLYVAAVEAERQEILPDGSEGSVELVRSWRPVQILDGKTRVDLVLDNGVLLMTEPDLNAMNAWRTMIEDRQDELMRPPLQEYLADRYWGWQVPEKVPGFEFNWEEWGVIPPPKIETTRARTGGDTIGAAQADILRQARADLKKAQEAFDKKEFEEADALLQPLLGNPDMPAGDRTAMADLERRLKPEMERIFREQALRERRNEGLDPNLVDTEPMWINDMSASPGHNYRYRLRVLAFNQFAGVSIQLKNPQDAARIILPGKWSEWSDPIRVQPAKYLLLTATNKEKETARLELFQWARGTWESALAEAGIGEKISATRGSNTFGFDGVILDIVYNRDFLERRVDGNGRISFAPRPTDAVTLMLADGDVEERVRAQDVDIAREIRAEIKLEEDRKKAASGDGGQMRQPRSPQRMPRASDRGGRPPIYGPMGGPGPKRGGGS